MSYFISSVMLCVVLTGTNIYYYDFTWAHGKELKVEENTKEIWDTGHVLASLQGIVNRAEPRLFVRFLKDADDFWWNELTKSGSWLESAKIEKVGNWFELLKLFEPFIHGVVIYSEKFPPTSNLASIIAGLENRLCLRYDPDENSVFTKVMNSGMSFTQNTYWLIEPETNTLKHEVRPQHLPEKANGSLKAQCYLWAKEQFLDTGLCSPEFMAYYIDGYWFQKPWSASFPNSTIMNHDFFISRRAFFFDLGIWEDEKTIDEPEQILGSDRVVLRELLQSMYQNAKGEVFHIGGFVPWIWKYTNEGEAGGQHGGVPTEWELVKFVSAYNAILDADALGLAGLANASFYQHYPLKDYYPQNPKPTHEQMRQQGYLDEKGNVLPNVYICFYMGDFDSSAWLYQKVPEWWQDPAHGAITCIWPFNPNLSRRVPHVFDYVRTHATSNDWFVYGDCGAGYLNPGMLTAIHREPNIPSGWDAWTRHNLYYGKRFDLTITGFIIDGYAPPITDEGFEAYSIFSKDGIVAQKIPPVGCYDKKLPYVRMGIDLNEPPEKASEILASYTNRPLPNFKFIRTILKSPSWHKSVIDLTSQKTNKVIFTDPYTFFELIKIHYCNR